MRLKNEVTVGVVVLVGLAIMVVGALWLSGKPWAEQQKELVAIFPQAGQLTKGNPVKFRGVQQGRVTGIELAPGGEGVLVTMEVDPDLVLPPQPAVVLSPASLFGDWQASLISMPQAPDLQFTRTRTPGILPGAALPDITELTAVGARIANDMETLAGRVELAFTEETALKIRQTVDNISEIAERMNGFVDQQTKTYAGVSQNVLEATRNINQATQTVQQVAGNVQTEIPLIVANARQASMNLEQLSRNLQGAAQGIPSMVSRADTTLDRLNTVATSLSGLVDQVGPQVQEIGPTIVEARQAMATLQRAAAKIEEGDGTLGRLMSDPALYEETQAAIATLRRILADLQANPGKYIGAVKVF
jgi:phospholipid/cholesterol/gamma-HCH transport system substrate-binding protein